MRILFDHGAPSGIAGSLSGHDVTEAIERGWDRVSNGELLKVAEAAGFDVLLTTDNCALPTSSKEREKWGTHLRERALSKAESLPRPNSP